ncbi:MAG: ribose-phosphate diphosphokinase [Steroidobacter sp.]
MLDLQSTREEAACETSNRNTSTGKTSTSCSPALFALGAARDIGRHVADTLGVPLRMHEEREFDYGEHKIRPLESVRNRAVYVMQSLHGDQTQSANDRLCRLLFFIGALKDAGAASVTACLTYLAYARKDRRTQSRDPVTSRYVAMLFEAMKMDRIMALEVHNPAAFDNAFRCEAAHVTATSLFAAHFSAMHIDNHAAWTLLSPDVGGIKRVQQLRGQLAHVLGDDLATAFIDKQRSAGIVSGDTLVGNVSNRRVLIYDDLISSGTTLHRAAQRCHDAGAVEIHVAATHAAFTGAAVQLFEPGLLNSVVVTDSVELNPAFHHYRNHQLVTLAVAPLFAQAIKRMEAGGSLSELRL